MDQLITERTAGRHRIMVFHSGELGDGKAKPIEQTRAGIIAINRVNAVPRGAGRYLGETR
jgi:TRAP-type C4-dicarboxylate transport system substrate-binding protein